MDIKTLTSAEEWGTRTTGQIGPTMHYEEEEKMIQRYKLCLYRDGTPMVESDDGNYVLYADHLSILEAEKKTWRCFNCGFETSDKTEAEAHFGEGEGGVGLCVEWSNMDSSERVRAYQELTMELNETREENIALEAAVKEKEKQIELYLRTTRGHLSTIFVLNERIAALTAMLEFSVM